MTSSQGLPDPVQNPTHMMVELQAPEQQSPPVGAQMAKHFPSLPVSFGAAGDDAAGRDVGTFAR